MMGLRRLLRNRLQMRRKTVASIAYMQRLKKKYPHLDLDHILGSNKEKLNDFLLCPIPHELHMRIENGIEVAGYSFEERLMMAIEELISDNDLLYNKLLKSKVESE